MLVKSLSGVLTNQRKYGHKHHVPICHSGTEENMADLYFTDNSSATIPKKVLIITITTVFSILYKL